MKYAARLVELTTMVKLCSIGQTSREEHTTIGTLRGVRKYWQSSDDDAVGAGEVWGHVVLVASQEWRVRWRALVAGFALLVAAFAADAVIVANTVDGDSGEAPAVYCFGLDGTLRWQLPVAVDCSMAWLGWDAEADSWLGIRFNVEHRERDQLLRWSRDGQLLSTHAMELSGEYAILAAGRCLVTGSGQVIDTRTGAIVGRLAPVGEPGALRDR